MLKNSYLFPTKWLLITEQKKAMLKFIVLFKICLYLEGPLCDIKSKPMGIHVILKCTHTGKWVGDNKCLSSPIVLLPLNNS